MTKALFKLFILFITCSTAISCSEQDSPELPDNSGNTKELPLLTKHKSMPMEADLSFV